jgi:hypothetical protein
MYLVLQRLAPGGDPPDASFAETPSRGAEYVELWHWHYPMLRVIDRIGFLGRPV